MTDRSAPPEFGNADLTSCDREPIHTPGAVQSFGCLLATTPDWQIKQASANTRDILGIAPDDLIGSSFVAHFSEDFIHALRTRMQTNRGPDAVRMFKVDVLGDARRFNISASLSNRIWIIEFEPAEDAENRDDISFVQPLIARIRRHSTVLDAAREAARALRALTGFERVMVYRFGPDMSGEVIAEAAPSDAVSFLNLRFPASDIPRQARELYTKNLLRLIPDTEAETAPLLPATPPSGDKLDLSFAITRAVSPIHLEYLRNMGVRSSMSVSIIANGKLWGLLACHGSTPHFIDYERRTAVELFAQLFTYELIQIEYQDLLTARSDAESLRDRMMLLIADGRDPIAEVDQIAHDLAEVIQFDGMCMSIDGRYRAVGEAPTASEFEAFKDRLAAVVTEEVFATDDLAAFNGDADLFGGRIAGFLAIPISRMPRDYLVLFRGEVLRSVTWAGDPSKPAEPGPNGDRLTPRKSFAAWKETVKGRSVPWTEEEIRTADALRITLLEVVLKLADQANTAQRKASSQQEVLIAELNHRVRNILNLIRGLVAQSRASAKNFDDFRDILDNRINALARAHDQLTKSGWAAASFTELLQTEVTAFVGHRAHALELSGTDIAFQPETLQTIALVFHELVTNAVKYGALSTADGKVSVTLSQDPDGSARIIWAESGGPPVSPPTRQGFGTTLIVRSIPHELKGTARLDHAAGGVRAEFTIPRAYFEVGSEILPSAAPRNAGTDTGPKQVLSGSVLLVEDNIVIALDVADTLRDLGATDVHTTGTVAEALEIAGKTSLELAVLDAHLGSETSREVAEWLDRANIPFLVASGYGADDAGLRGFPAATFLKKPYDVVSLRAAIKTALATYPDEPGTP